MTPRYRVRNLVHRRIFGQVLVKLSSAEITRLEGLVKTTEIVQRHTSFQEIKESPQKPSLTHLDVLLDHLAWLESLGEVNGPLSGIPPALVQHFATEAKRFTPVNYERSSRPKGIPYCCV